MPEKKWDKPPVEVGDTLSTVVTSIGKSGDPIIKAERYILFVKVTGDTRVNKGDMVAVRVTKTLPSFGFAELIEGGE